MSIKNIEVQDCLNLLKEDNTYLIDVREVSEFEEVHAQGACNIPLSELNAESVKSKAGASENDRILLICRSGSRSMTGAQLLQGMGFKDLSNVEGGTLKWVEEELPSE